MANCRPKIEIRLAGGYPRQAEQGTLNQKKGASLEPDIISQTGLCQNRKRQKF
jgi:hypothetical protein